MLYEVITMFRLEGGDTGYHRGSVPGPCAAGLCIIHLKGETSMEKGPDRKEAFGGPGIPPRWTHAAKRNNFV